MSWIAAHPGCLGSSVPDHLLDYWLAQAEAATDDSFTIFAFGLVASEMARGQSKESAMQLLLDEQSGRFYSDWRIKLALAKVDRATEIAISPVVLFSSVSPAGITISPRRSM